MNLNGQPTNPNSEMLEQLTNLSRGEQPSLEPEEIQAQSDVEAQEPIQSDDTITIDGKVFSSVKEAYDYSQKKLQDSETDRLILQARQEAYEQAMSMGQTRQQAYQVSENLVPPEADDATKFYDDPQAYLRDMRQKIKAEVQGELSQADLERQTWNDFFSRHPDLDGFRQDCELVLNQNLDTVKLLATKDRNKAMDYLATKTREKFQSYIERTKPRTVLPNTHSVPSVGGNHVPSVTQSKKDDSTLDFVSQLRSLNNR